MDNPTFQSRPVHEGNAVPGFHARRGRLTLKHGVVETPVFMPVGTYGAVKSLTPDEIAASGSQILLGNTYHLYLRPGLEIIRQFSGLHDFMNWRQPILTDSGGFQVFSLGKSREISEDGIGFRSHLNGERIFLSPELAAEIQRALGSDVAMLLDECIALPASEDSARNAAERSYRWGKRFLATPKLEGQRIFGIVQGGTSQTVRRESLEQTLDLKTDGLAIGGLSVGEPHAEMVDTLDFLAPHLPSELPHYLMGVGTPLDILEAVRCGIDMFDCVMPTRNARNGSLFTSTGRLNIRNHIHRLSKQPVDEKCNCPTCRSYSRSYLRHLFLTHEMLGCRLATIHNLHYYHGFLSDIRTALEQGEFPSFYRRMLPSLREFYLGSEKSGESDE